MHWSGGPQPGGGSQVHGGPRAAAAKRLTGAQARGCYGEWKLTGSGGKEKGAPGVPTVGEGGRYGGGVGRATMNGGGGRWWTLGTCYGAGRGEKSSGRSCG